MQSTYRQTNYSSFLFPFPLVHTIFCTSPQYKQASQRFQAHQNITRALAHLFPFSCLHESGNGAMPIHIFAKGLLVTSHIFILHEETREKGKRELSSDHHTTKLFWLRQIF
ncbi:unnamed protein product [Musa banksii]